MWWLWRWGRPLPLCFSPLKENGEGKGKRETRQIEM